MNVVFVQQVIFLRKEGIFQYKKPYSNLILGTRIILYGNSSYHRVEAKDVARMTLVVSSSDESQVSQIIGCLAGALDAPNVLLFHETLLLLARRTARNLEIGCQIYICIIGVFFHQRIAQESHLCLGIVPTDNSRGDDECDLSIEEKGSSSSTRYDIWPTSGFLISDLLNSQLDGIRCGKLLYLTRTHILHTHTHKARHEQGAYTELTSINVLLNQLNSQLLYM
jgi:hypothetical protein